MTIETHLSGFHLATSTVEMTRQNGEYHMTTKTRSQGFLDNFMKADFQTEASGQWTRETIKPGRYTSAGESYWGKFASEIRYDGDRPEIVRLDATANNPDEEGEWLEVPEEMTLGTVDPLTAVLTGTLQAGTDEDTACRSNVAVFNGWSRMDFSLSGQEEVELQPDQERFYAGRAFRCLLEIERIAGGRKKELEDESREPTPPGEIWLADFQGYSIPVRFQLESRIGFVVAHLTDVTIDGTTLALAEFPDQ